MKTFTVTYNVVYELSIAPHYVWNEHNECYNLRTGKRLKQVVKGSCLGYNIKGKFMSLKKLRPLLRKPKINKLPF
jgi:hypothetical protein